MIDEPARRLDEGALRGSGRDLIPRVLAGLVRRGEDFDAAEDALQEALLEALRVWPEHPPRDPRAWLTTVATRRLVDARRSQAARHRREEQTYAEPRPDGAERRCGGLLVPVTLHQRSGLAAQLGADSAAPGPIAAAAIAVNGRYETTVPGLFAAGDASAQLPSVANAIAAGSNAANAIVGAGLA